MPMLVHQVPAALSLVILPPKDAPQPQLSPEIPSCRTQLRSELVARQPERSVKAALHKSHHHPRSAQIPIEPAEQLLPHIPRFPALALLGRQLVPCVISGVVPSVLETCTEGDICKFYQEFIWLCPIIPEPLFWSSNRLDQLIHTAQSIGR